MSSFNQLVPSVNTLINSSNCIVLGNTSSGTALTVQQLGAGAVMNVATSTGSSALFVSSTGQVGIGQTNPQTLLHVTATAANSAIFIDNSITGGATPYNTVRPSASGAGSANCHIWSDGNAVGTSDAGFLRIAAGGGTAGITKSYIDISGYSTVADMNQNIVFGTSGSEKMRITTGGNVGIGTTSPSTALHVNGGQISVPSFVSSPGSPYTTGQQFYFAFNGNLTDSQSGVATTTFGTQGGFVNSAAVRFNGSYYFTFPNSLVTSVVSQTVAFWWCPLSTAPQTLFSFSSGAGAVNMNIDVASGKINAYIATPNQWTVAALGSGAVAPLGTWVHVALTCSTTAATLYYNGVQVDQQTGTYTNGTFGMGTVYVGTNGDGQSRRANCLLDELRVYNIVLTAVQVATLYSSTTFTVNGVSGGSLLTNSIGVGVTTPLNSIDSAGSMALGYYAGTNQAPAGGLICPGNVGIGTTNPAVAFVVNSTSGMQCTGTYSCQCYYGWTVYNGQGTQVVLVNHVSNGDAQGWNAAAAIMNIGRANTTARSVSAGGTINASGADYAEYMTKTGDFTIKKGDMVGVNAQGLLTTVFADSVSFMVKSTDPSYVGGDTWGSEDVLGMKRPESTPQKEGESDEDYAKRQQDLALFNANLEEARARVDRIAFAGQVPVNVLGATPGQYIVPVANEDGSISGQAVSKPTIEQYMAAVGKVIKILPDGRAQIIVKVV